MAHTTLKTMPKGMNTVEDYTQAINALVVVRDHAKANTIPYPFCGICANWLDAVHKANEDSRLPIYSLVDRIAMDWPQSKSPGVTVAFPIPDDYDYGYWHGPNLTARLSLINYMLVRLRSFRQQLQKRQE